jgi:hypothetical protein
VAKLKLYCTTCEGQGDTEIKLVDEATWKWIQGEGPVPQTTIDKAKENDENPSDWEFGWSGSSQNDKVLWAKEVELEVPGHPESPKVSCFFTSTKDFVNFCREWDIEILESFEGYIY